jgi:indolepyruvate ferredoxin oxidoreductase alpha subunit
MHKLLTENPGQKMLLLGNEAIARGAIEAGVAVASTYPGTPSSEISLQFFQVSQESNLYFEYSTNEKVAMEVAAAAANSGVRSMCVMKHVGVNVAADALMTLAYVGVKGGMIVLTADDPYMLYVFQSKRTGQSFLCQTIGTAYGGTLERRRSQRVGRICF